MANSLDIAFFGSSLVSAYWNGAATYYRGIIRALADRGHHITFYEPDAFERQQHRDLADPDWADVVVYSADGTDHLYDCLDQARGADVIVKASGVGVFDELLEREITLIEEPILKIFWDVDAPATLQRLREDPEDPFHVLIPRYDLVLTYGGGPPVVEAYRRRGARECVPIYNAVSPEEHFPVPPEPRFAATLSFLGNRLPDREQRVFDYFFETARRLPDQEVILGGSGWDVNVPALENVNYVGHVYTRDHNAFNTSPLAVLNISRDSMAANGFSPATRLFEAAGAAACIITDSWEGIDQFLEPDREVLVAADGAEVVRQLQSLTRVRAREIGAAARERVLAEHTYGHRGGLVEEILLDRTTGANTHSILSRPLVAEES